MKYPNEQLDGHDADLSAADKLIESLRQQLDAARAEAAHVKEVEFPRKIKAVVAGWDTKIANLEKQVAEREKYVVMLRYALERLVTERTSGLASLASWNHAKEVLSSTAELRQQLADIKNGRVGRSGDSTKNDRIFLQVCQDEESEWVGEVTWCQDRINEDDVMYIRADIVEQQLAAKDVEIERLKTV